MILGFFTPGIQAPFVRVNLVLPDLSEFSKGVDFLIDTGSTESTLHPLNAARQFGIAMEVGEPLALTGIMESRVGVGGISSTTVVPAHYAFSETSGEQLTLAAEIRVAQPTETNLYLPSILGWDILQHFALFIDWRTKVVQLQ